MPADPDALQDHLLLRYSLIPSRQVLSFTDAAGQQRSVDMPVRLSSNNGDFLMQAAIAGHGMVVLPTFIVADAIQQGSLQIILGDLQWRSPGLYAVYPQTRHLSVRVRELINYLQQHFTARPYWDQLVS